MTVLKYVGPVDSKCDLLCHPPPGLSIDSLRLGSHEEIRELPEIKKAVPEETITVDLCRSGQQKLGLAIVGGVDNPRLPDVHVGDTHTHTHTHTPPHTHTHTHHHNSTHKNESLMSSGQKWK